MSTFGGPPDSGVNSTFACPALTGLKSSRLVKCTAKSAARPATSGGYSMNNSVLSVQCVTSSVGSSCASAGARSREQAES